MNPPDAKRSLLYQVLRYGLVGMIVFACDFSTYALIIRTVPGAYLAANLMGKALGAAVGFVLHKHFTFSWNQKHGTPTQIVSYLGLMLFNFASSSLLLWLLVTQLGLGKYGAKLIVDMVVIATSFVVGRLWVYKPA